MNSFWSQIFLWGSCCNPRSPYIINILLVQQKIILVEEVDQVVEVPQEEVEDLEFWNLEEEEEVEDHYLVMVEEVGHFLMEEVEEEVV